MILDLNLDHLKLIQYTGWDGWLARLEWEPLGFEYISEPLRTNMLAKVLSMDLPHWDKNRLIASVDWGSVARCDDDGIAAILRRAHCGTYYIAALATSDSFWLKIVLEIRGA